MAAVGSDRNHVGFANLYTSAVISESTGAVRIFIRGKIFIEIEKTARE